MPTNAIETIRNSAIEQTSLLSVEVKSLPWFEGLSQLERLITAPSITEKFPAATKLLKEIATDSDFMIMLVFNKDHTKATALPLPEVHEGEYPRTELGIHPSSHPIALLEISRNVSRALDLRKYNPEPWVEPDVVLIEKQLGNQRKYYPITVANLNGVTYYPQKEKYMDWIQRTKDELNGVPSSGKKFKNAV